MALTEMLEEITTAKDKKNVYCGSFFLFKKKPLIH